MSARQLDEQRIAREAVGRGRQARDQLADARIRRVFRCEFPQNARGIARRHPGNALPDEHDLESLDLSQRCNVLLHILAAMKYRESQNGVLRRG